MYHIHGYKRYGHGHSSLKTPADDVCGLFAANNMDELYLCSFAFIWPTISSCFLNL